MAQDTEHHGFGEPPGLRVLPAGVIAAKKGDRTPGQLVLRSVCEWEVSLPQRRTSETQHGKVGIECQLAENKHGAQARQEFDFELEVIAAGPEFGP